jgi:ABC-type transport system involved in multi-copper enzyme maturation permease subunit
MRPLFPTFRRLLAWSNHRQAWHERGAVILLGAAAAGLGWYGNLLPTVWSIALWIALLAAVTLLARAGWFHLFGPLLGYDLVRTIRRSHIVLWRIVYTLFLFVLLLCLYMLFFYDTRDGFKGLWTGLSVRRSDLIAFAADFSYGFMVMQLVTVFVLTPAYTAGAVAEEKERGTLEGMLITDLGSREIVLGMLVSRLGILLLIVLGGLPILAALQFLGGIDPNIILATFAATGLSLVGLAGVSMLCSVYARRTRQAIIQSYLVVLGYLILSALSELLLLPGLGLAKFPSTGVWKSPITVTSLVNALNAGNIVTVGWKFVNDLKLANALRGYAWFHGLLAAGCILWATLRLRHLALRERTPATRGRFAGSLRDGLGIGNYPMLWKALVVDTRGRRGPLGLLLAGLLIAGLIWPALQVVYYFGRTAPASPEDPLSNLLNLWIRGAGALIGCFLLLGVAVRASGGISGERERQTLDGLLATTLTNREILFSKWLGSMVNDRWPWFWLGLVFGIGLATQALHPLAIGYFALAWLVYAALLTGLGLWFSVAARNSRRALMGTLVSCFLGMVFFMLGAYDLAEGWLSASDAYSLLPPQTLAFLAFSPIDYQEWSTNSLKIRVIIYPLALAVCACAALTLWFLVQIRFRHLTGRELLPDEQVPVSAVDAPPSNGVTKHRKALVARVLISIFTLLPWRSLPRTFLRVSLMSLPLIALVGWYFHLAAQRESALQEALAEMDRQDEYWRRQYIQRSQPQLPDAQRSAQRILDQAPWIPWEVFGNERMQRARYDQELNVRLEADSIADIKAALDRYHKFLDEARGLAEMPNANFGLREVGNYNTGLWQKLSQRVNNLSTLLWFDILLRLHSSDPDGALTSCRARINLARSQGDESAFVALGMRLQIVESTISLIERTLAQGEPSDQALAALQDLLTDEASRPLFFARLRAKWALTDHSLMEEFLLPELRRLPQHPVRVPSPDGLATLLESSTTNCRMENLRIYRQLLAAAKLPPLERSVRFVQLAANLQANPAGPFSPRGSLFDPRWELTAQENWEARITCIIVALAAERYRRQHGTWPASLSDLVPALLPALPIDPLDGQPLRYRRLRDGVVIYSVGPDGIDNGGNLPQLGLVVMGAGGMGRPGGIDVGIRLWDPAQRRLPPSVRKRSPR